MSMRPLFDDPGCDVSDYATLKVDIEALADVANALRQEVDGNLRPHVGPLNLAYGMGVKFGLTSHSENMKRARKAYHDCLVQATESFANRIAAGEALAAALDEIARRYGGADAMAKARSDDVSKVIDETTKTTPLPNLMPMIEQFSGRSGSFE
jgi:hypothetical protein